MIYDESEYKTAVGRLAEEEQRLRDQEERLKEEIKGYEHLKRGEFGELRNFGGWATC